MWKDINHPRPFTCPLLLISLIWIFNMWREKGLILINIFAYQHQRRIANYDASSVIFNCCDHQSHCKLVFFSADFLYAIWYWYVSAWGEIAILKVCMFVYQLIVMKVWFAWPILWNSSKIFPLCCKYVIAIMWFEGGENISPLLFRSYV